MALEVQQCCGDLEGAYDAEHAMTGRHCWVGDATLHFGTARLRGRRTESREASSLTCARFARAGARAREARFCGSPYRTEGESTRVGWVRGEGGGSGRFGFRVAHEAHAGVVARSDLWRKE
eukprot:6673620-Prymnesium_polylepis.2